MKRVDLIEKIAQQSLDAADLDALMEFYFDSQINFLEGLTDMELKEYAKEYAEIDTEIE